MSEVVVKHNFDKNQFKWLFSKYACGANPHYHCTNAIKGKYSKIFNRKNPDFDSSSTVIFNEYPQSEWDAIYICGVSKKGYSMRENYSHNVHAVIIPKPGATDKWTFENWEMTVENGIFERIISEDELEEKYKNLPKEYTICRMFRWAVSHYGKQIEADKKKLSPDTHVYCTHCKHIKCLDVAPDDYPLDCDYKDECDFIYPEDSRCYADRPKYEPEEINYDTLVGCTYCKNSKYVADGKYVRLDCDYKKECDFDTGKYKKFTLRPKYEAKC